MWGAAPHPGREKFSPHPRHVCDVPEGDAKAAQEIQEIQEIQERPCGATDESAVLEPIRRALARVLFSVLRSPFSGALQRPFRLHRRQGGRPGSNLRGSSKLPNIQTSKLPFSLKTFALFTVTFQ